MAECWKYGRHVLCANLLPTPNIWLCLASASMYIYSISPRIPLGLGERVHGVEVSRVS